jgi:hypothetical protein
MVDKLLDLVKEHAGNAVVNNPAVPNAKNGLAIQSIADGILSGLQQQAGGKGFGNIVGMLASAGNVKPTVVGGVQQSVVSALTQKTGLGSGISQSIAAQIVPSILNSLSHKSADASNSSFDIGGILSSLTGGKTAGLDIQGMIDRGIGNGDGHLDISDVISMLGKTGNTASTATASKTKKTTKKVTKTTQAATGSGIDIGGLIGGLGKIFGG